MCIRDRGDKVTIDSSGNLLRGGTGQDIGAITAPWNKIYADEFLGQVGESQGSLEIGSLLVREYQHSKITFS